MPLIINFLYELLAKNGQAYIRPEDLYYRENQHKIWINVATSAEAIPSKSHSILVRYADWPGFDLELLSHEAIMKANKRLVDMSKTVHYDLVGHHLKTQPGSMLPVLSAVHKTDIELIIIPRLSNKALHTNA